MADLGDRTPNHYKEEGVGGGKDLISYLIRCGTDQIGRITVQPWYSLYRLENITP